MKWRAKKISKLCAIFTMAASLIIASAQGTNALAKSKSYVKSVSVSSKVSVKKGSSKTIKVTVKVKNSASKKMTVKVAKTSIAKAKYNYKTQKLTITGKKVGKTKITLTTKAKNSKGKKIKKTITVTVKKASSSTTSYVKSMSVSSKVAVKKGKSKYLTVTIKVKNNASKKLTVKVADTSIAKAKYNYKNQKLTITGKKAGKTKITLTTKAKNSKGNKIKKTITVTVKKVSTTKTTPVTSVSLSESSITLIPDTTKQLTATVKPSNATDASIKWTSSDDLIATVTNKGLVRGLKVGTVTVTAKNTASGKKATCEVNVNSPDTVTITGNVGRESDGSALSGVTVTLDQNTDAFSASSTQASSADDTTYAAASSASFTYTTISDENGDYTFVDVVVGQYRLIMHIDGYIDAYQFIDLSDEYNEVWQNETMEMLPEGTDNKTASISGKVKKATTGGGISGITVELRKYKNNTYGSALLTTTTGSDGSYTFDSNNSLAAGHYTVLAIDNQHSGTAKYITTSINVSVPADTAITNANVVMSLPVNSVSGSSLRFVLTWGSSTGYRVDRDLDSHLFGPASPLSTTGNTYHEIVYNNKQYGIGSQIYSALDVDDITWEGPETTTIITPLNGTYYFYVYNFSGRYTFATSKAKVAVYNGSQLLTTFNVPTAASTGRWWNVCSYNMDTGTLTGVNEIVSSVVLNGETVGRNGSSGNTDCDYGRTSLLTAISCASATIYRTYPYYDTDATSSTFGTIMPGTITVHTAYTWDEIKDSVSYTTRSGYYAELADSGYTLNIKNSSGTIVETYVINVTTE